MSRDRFTEKWENGRWEIEVSEQFPSCEVRKEPVVEPSGCTWEKIFLAGPPIDRLAEYEDLVFSPETLKAIIAEWREWADAINEGRMKITPKSSADCHTVVRDGSQ